MSHMQLSETIKACDGLMYVRRGGFDVSTRQGYYQQPNELQMNVFFSW